MFPGKENTAGTTGTASQQYMGCPSSSDNQRPRRSGDLSTVTASASTALQRDNSLEARN
jgi:hypothetical protein